MSRCLAKSYAALANQELSEVISKLGHDGSEVIHPDAEGDDRLRCFTVGEIYSLASAEGHVLTLYPLISDEAQAIMEKHDGIVVGVKDDCKVGHASAKINGQLLDWSGDYIERLFIKWN